MMIVAPTMSSVSPTAVTIVGRSARRCISMRPGGSVKRAICSQSGALSSALSSRSMRVRRFRLKAAVTPAESL